MSQGETPNFSGLARAYRSLEYLALGRDLERARFHFLARLCESRSVLIFGEGDGRFLQRLLAIAPAARVTCVEGSKGMIDAAEARLTPAQRDRVTFHRVDLRDFQPADGFDAVVTLFVLDCFATPEVEAIVSRTALALENDAVWVFADFALPKAGWRRWRAHVWLTMLYHFFGLATGLKVRALPDSEAVLERAGLSAIESREFQHRMLRTALFRRV